MTSRAHPGPVAGAALVGALASAPAWAAAPATETSAPATAEVAGAGQAAGPRDSSGGSTGAGAAGSSGSAGGATGAGAAGSSDSAGVGASGGSATDAKGGAKASAGGSVIGTSGAPPRVDGTYFGGSLAGGLGFARVNDFATPDPFPGGMATLRVGEVVYPWMSVGVEIAGNWAYRFADPRQRMLQGAFLIDFGFYPSRKVPLSLRAGFGAGGGAIREAGRSKRSGFGGAVFTASVRYEIFPLAAKKRKNRGGGFALGPELGWVGYLPAARGRPMSNTVYLGLFVGFYFGS